MVCKWLQDTGQYAFQYIIDACVLSGKLVKSDTGFGASDRKSRWFMLSLFL